MCEAAFGEFSGGIRLAAFAGVGDDAALGQSLLRIYPVNS